MSEDRSYNSWKNYETRCVALWIDNDQGMQETAREMGAEVGNAGVLANRLKDWLEELMPDLGASIWADMLNAAFSEVNWYEVALHYMPEEV